MLINFPQELPHEERLQVLLAWHKLPLDFQVEEHMFPLIVMALNQDDIIKAQIDNEGGLNIEYSGDEWQNTTE